jgi:hypothetical protein
MFGAACVKIPVRLSKCCQRVCYISRATVLLTQVIRGVSLVRISVCRVEVIKYHIWVGNDGIGLPSLVNLRSK